MCHDPGSRPPAPPRSVDVAERGTLTLTSDDGAPLSIAYAAPAPAPSVGVVILPDVRGLHPYYVALTEQFAQAGLAAVALDYFGRTAGPCDSTGTRTADFDWQRHVPQVTEAGVDADLRAALGYLRGRTHSDLPAATVGFCLGGSHSWRQAGGNLDIDGCIGFYGRPALVGESAERARRPTLMLVAGADRATPVEESLALADTMRSAGAEVETAVYDGAPHSFFDRSFTDWSQACQDAWTRMLALTDRLAAAR